MKDNFSYFSLKPYIVTPHLNCLDEMRGANMFLCQLNKGNNSYRKNSKNWDTSNNYHNCPTNGTVGFYSAVLRSKDADRITNREDPDQTAPCGAV